MNMDIIAMLKTLPILCLSFLLISCGSEEEKELETKLSPSFYDLKIEFTQAEQDLGVVNIQPNNLVCKTTCTSNLAADSVVELTATPKADAVFVEWGGVCSGNTTCQVTMSSIHTVTASFAKISAVHELSVQITNGGSISLTDDLGECKEDCKFNFANGKEITINSTPNTDHIFVGWAGSCTGNSSCPLTMSGTRAVTATFEKASDFTLSTEISTGGSISFKNGTYECIDSCKFNLVQDELIDVIATPKYGYKFKNWLGDCSGQEECKVTIDGAKAITANFEALPVLKLATTISAGGTISINNDLHTCAAETECNIDIPENEAVIIKPLPSKGYIFSGWSGDCTGNSACEFTMSTAHNVTAKFIEIPAGELLTLKLTKGGSIALPDNLGECFIDCQLSFANSEVLTLTAIPEVGYIFTGWSEDCTSDTTCQVIMSAARSVTATFTEEIIISPTEATLLLTVGVGGSVALSDSFGDCVTDCELTFTEQEAITITAIPEAGYTFSSWSGDCVGDSNCLVTMSANHAVAAIFKPTSNTCATQAPLPATSFDADPEYAYHNPANDGSKVETFLTDFVVKESSGKGASNYPVSMVFPVKQSTYFHPGDFHIKNSVGEVVPAQFNVINRWWAKDRSLRHIQAHFTVDIDSYVTGQADTGIKSFKLYAGNGNIKPNYSVCTTESDTDIQLDNGLVDIKITKNPLTITTPAGQLKSIFVKEDGNQDYSFDHDNIKIELEEVGALRAVVKISSLTNYVSPTDIKHGWAIRFYMYADTDKVKVDFQLQNSALNTQYSAPLYFKSHHLTLDNTGSKEAISLKADKIDGDEISSGLSGAISSPNVNVFFRDFWQKFPQGLSTSVDGKLSMELWPSWSKQFLDAGFAEANFYWLDDMRQTYKEVLLDFSKETGANYLANIAGNFQYSPVASLPQDYYAKTRVTLELGGYFPTTAIPTEEFRTPQYISTDFSELASGSFKFGLDNFGLDLSRKKTTNGTGGWPYSQRRYFITGNPKDFYDSQVFSKAEINVRPQWLSGYTHTKDFNLINPTANPYGGSTWRDFLGHGVATLNREYIAGSEQVSKPRDDQHAWFYHVEHAYLMSGNKWIRDWYTFMAEYKKVYLLGLDPFPDTSNRAEGHSLAVAISAYKATDNTSLGNLLENYLKDVHSNYVLAPHNIVPGKLNQPTSNGALFQQGYLTKQFVELFYEFPEQSIAIEQIKNYANWNYDYANFSYYRSITSLDVTNSASGTSMSFIDVAIWYSVYSTDNKYAEHANNFIQNGIGGTFPYGDWGPWIGQFESQLYNYYLQQL